MKKLSIAMATVNPWVCVSGELGDSGVRQIPKNTQEIFFQVSIRPSQRARHTQKTTTHSAALARVCVFFSVRTSAGWALCSWDRRTLAYWLSVWSTLSWCTTRSRDTTTSKILPVSLVFLVNTDFVHIALSVIMCRWHNDKIQLLPIPDDCKNMESHEYELCTLTKLSRFLRQI